jgi:GR25 family glycosyltransferase involved in LPS biosynthesis
MASLQKVHWITLDLDSKRARKFVENSDRLGLINEPFIAKRGDTFNLDVSPAMRSSLTKPQLGCLSSHMEMILRASFKKEEENWFFVCEDDADLLWSSKEGDRMSHCCLKNIPKDADCVILHVHLRPLLDMFKVPRFFANTRSEGPVGPKGPKREQDAVNFTKGMATFTCVAYLLRPSAAKRIVDKHYDRARKKWVGLPPIPSDVLFSKFHDDGLWTVYSIPLIGEMTMMDSALTKSSLPLRARRMGGRALKRALLAPSDHRTVMSNNVEMAKSVYEEFGTEILVAGGLIFVLLGGLLIVVKK